jgi:hypothetical protein
MAPGSQNLVTVSVYAWRLCTDLRTQLRRHCAISACSALVFPHS